MNLGEIFSQLEITVNSPALREQTVLAGGPLQPQSGFVLHPPHGKWTSSVVVDSHIAITTSKDILMAIASGQFLDPAVLALGYAGWGPGQLESEIARNDWLCSPASGNVIYHTPLQQRWEEAIHLLGVESLAQLSMWAGHA
jgi:putative transcriptional regulator